MLDETMPEAELPTMDDTRPITRREYEELVELGWFRDEKVELLEGRLVRMSPQGPPHAEIVASLNEVLVEAVRGRARVRPQLPFSLDDLSEPEPDLAIVPLGTYRDAHPSRALLVIEVSETSLGKDQRLKNRLYAAAGIPEYWLVDVAGVAIEVRSSPTAKGYARIERVTGGEIEISALPGATLDVDAILAVLRGR
jgi:Uma2 family endonuclease